MAALAVAVGWGVLLLGAAFVLPMYDSESANSTGEVSSGTATSVEVNGLSSAIIFGIPLLISLAVGLALWFRETRAGVPIAWTLTGLLALGNVLALLTIGVFVLPVTVALVVACSSARRATARTEPATIESAVQPPA